MNKENIQKLITHLETLKVEKPENDVGFNMATFFHTPTGEDLPDQTGQSCGSAACIGGHISLLVEKAEKLQRNQNFISCSLLTKEFLGIPYNQALQLIYPLETLNKPLEDFSLEEAITTLKGLRDTGEIDWSHVSH